ncbi:MAG: 50S ribosomal protein L6 [Syntrophaceae bacterium PtaU1.Bin231]|nr:MAG: 50S ribosomal protein L6 [Syntrophaceae bacterium PtaU1.Bin231]HOG16367.1 50S ribosomal protein L6 [Syntrophales bacterium]
MSRIGKKPVEIPKGVKVSQGRDAVKVEGPKGALTQKLPPGIEIHTEANALSVRMSAGGRQEGAYQGLVRTLVANMVKGVSSGFEKSLEISGVGYRAEVSGQVLKLSVGYSSPVEYSIPKGITVKVDKLINISISGIDKELVGRAAAEIRSLRKPEPYKGKGIKYVGEHVRRKVGKSVGA